MKLYAKVVLFLFVLISFFSISIAEDLWMKLGWIEPTDKIFYTCQNEIYINTEDSITQYSQYRSKDNGSSWEKLNYHEWCRGVKYVSNDGNYLYLTAFDSIDGNGVVVSSRLFKVHKDSTNLNPLLKIGCTSMNKCRDNFYFLQWGKIIKSNMNLSDSSIVIDTNNKSACFTSLVSDSTGTLYSGSTTYIGEGGLYRSLDNGGSWTGPGPDLLNDFISSMAVDTEGRIFVGTRGHYDLGTGRIYRSENNGNTWEKVVYEYVFISDILINSDDEIFAGLVSGGVIYSKDHGDTWNYINEGLSGSGEIQDMAISPDGYIYLATDGGVYRSLNSTTGIESDNNLIFDFVLNQNYPNPFNSETAISFSISHDSDVVLSVFNIKGEFVENIFAGKLYKGLFNYSFKTDNLNSGIYFYSLAVNGKQVATKRMLYLK